MVLTGTQQSVELKLALDQEQQKSKRLVESMKKLDLEMRRTDELLYQMIPKQVADRLRNGENPVETCQVSSNENSLEPIIFYTLLEQCYNEATIYTDFWKRFNPLLGHRLFHGYVSISLKAK